MMGDSGLHCGPIFIGGMERSGKTYMRLMLSTHPNFVISRRTNMWPSFYNKYGELKHRENFERCLEAMLRQKHIHSLQPDAGRIQRDFWQGPPTYSRLFALIHEQYAEKKGKRRWGDQTELIERFAGPILAAYPHARIIHLIRDPRDCYEAALSEKPGRRGRVGGATARWIYSTNLASHNQQSYSDCYKVVRYESMVMNPEATMGEICQFLGEPYTPSMIAMENVPRFREKDYLAVRPNLNPLTAEFIGRFRRKLSTEDVAFIQKYAGQQMNSHGYLPVPIDLSTLKKLRSLPYWGINVAHMLGWHILKFSRM
jgi:hypothetical protein